MRIFAIISALLLSLFGGLSYAQPAQQNLTAEQNERFTKLATEIRCVVCQSEPVSTSSSKIAMDMRDVIKQRILMGENDRQIRTYFANHYGEYVLLRPQLGFATIALWVSPFLLLLLGGLIIFGIVRTKKTDAPPSNTDEDAEAIEALKQLEK